MDYDELEQLTNQHPIDIGDECREMECEEKDCDYKVLDA